MTVGIPRWAFERMEDERAKHLGVKPNPLNVNVFMRDPAVWTCYHAFAAYIARTEKPPVNWRPIETAPKDGTIIDLWLDGERLTNCFWPIDEPADDNGAESWWRQQYSEQPCSSFPVEGKPTHWMSLPVAPQ